LRNEMFEIGYKLIHAGKFHDQILLSGNITV